MNISRFYLKCKILTFRAGKPGSRTGFPLLPQFHTLAGVTGGYLNIKKWKEEKRERSRRERAKE